MVDVMQFTDWFILAVILCILAVDVVLVAMQRPTISNKLRHYGDRVAAFPFMWGVLGGHFWGPSAEPVGGNWATSVTALALVMFVCVVLHRWTLLTMNLPRWVVALYLFPGIASGMVFWPQ